MTWSCPCRKLFPSLLAYLSSPPPARSRRQRHPPFSRLSQTPVHPSSQRLSPMHQFRSSFAVQRATPWGHQGDLHAAHARVCGESRGPVRARVFSGEDRRADHLEGADGDAAASVDRPLPVSQEQQPFCASLQLSVSVCSGYDKKRRMYATALSILEIAVPTSMLMLVAQHATLPGAEGRGCGGLGLWGLVVVGRPYSLSRVLGAIHSHEVLRRSTNFKSSTKAKVPI